MIIRSKYCRRLAVLCLATLLTSTACANSVVYMGLEHNSLGSASLEVTAQNTLRVFDLGNSGSDGVAITFGDANYINIGTGDDDDKNGSGSTKGKSISAFGTIGSFGNQFLGGSSIELANDTFSIVANFSAVQPTFRRVEVWRDGSLVEAFPDFSGIVSYPGTFEDFPKVVRLDLSPVDALDLTWSGWRHDLLFSIGSHGQFLGDEIRIHEEVTVQIDHLSEARLTTIGFLEFTLGGVAVPEPGNCSLAAMALGICLCRFRRA